ncbi:hypothetical protein [Barnesiella intestinihominis]
MTTLLQPELLLEIPVGRIVEVAVVYAQQKTAQQPVKNHALSSVMKCSHN